MRALALGAGLLIVLLVAGPVGAQAVAPFNTMRLYPTEEAFGRAIQPYQHAISVDARNARAQYWLGFAYLYAYRQWLAGAAPYAAGYLPRAVQPLEEAIKLAPARPDAYLALQDVYHLMGDLDKANAVVREMLEKTRPGWLPAIPAPAP